VVPLQEIEAEPNCGVVLGLRLDPFREGANP